jgi:hypothetical protein
MQDLKSKIIPLALVFIFIGAAYIILNPQNQDQDEERQGPPRFAAALGLIDPQTPQGMCLNKIIEATSYDESVIAMDILKKTTVNDEWEVYSFALEFGRYISIPDDLVVGKNYYASVVSMQGYNKNNEIEQLLSLFVCDNKGKIID